MNVSLLVLDRNDGWSIMMCSNDLGSKKVASVFPCFMLLGQVAAGVAHDFNNSLAVVRGNLDLIKEDPLNRDEYFVLAKRGDLYNRDARGFNGSEGAPDCPYQEPQENNDWQTCPPPAGQNNEFS